MDGLDHGHGGEGGLGGIQAVGIINALKTGNVAVDMAIAMCIPIFLRFIFGMIGQVHANALQIDWLKWWRRRNKMHERKIVFKSLRSDRSTVDLDEDTQNNILIKAIQLYLDRCALRLLNANLNLTSLDDTGTRSRSNYYWGYDDNDEKTLAGTLSKYKIVKKPPIGEWHDIGKFGSKDGKGPTHTVEMYIEENEEDIGGGEKASGTSQKHTATLTFRSQGENSIDTFIEMAYEWYLDELRKLDDESRYYYDLKSSGTTSSDDDVDDRSHVHKRYKLSEEKTFESLFFKEKKKLLNIVRHFTEKSGKYAIKGYPHKLGLLLHGPPGTGKTSLIKALAEHTGRSIVNVPLSRIATNSELTSIMFDQKYHVEGEEVPIKLGFKDVIFVLEDVDAAAKIVRRRDGKLTADVTHTEHVEFPDQKTLWRMLLESPDPACRELVESLMEKSERLKKAALEPEMIRSLTRRMGAVPGLSLVGEVEGTSATLSKISEEALQSASDIMQGYDTVDRFLGIHAGVIKAALDAGADVDEALENDLLSAPSSWGNDNGNSSPASPTRPKPAFSRDVSYEKYPGIDGVRMESKGGKEAMMQTFAQMMLSQDNNESSKTSGEKDVAAIDKLGSTKGTFGPANPFAKLGKDHLNLSGLLNVLDGVVDTPERILVMTTNHPEMLDPAIIRPGRIDQMFFLGHMRAEDVIDMLKHYFQDELEPNQEYRVKLVINGNDSSPAVNLTPAQVEQLASEHDELEDMICALEQKAQPLASPKVKGVKTLSKITYGI